MQNEARQMEDLPDKNVIYSGHILIRFLLDSIINS